MKKSIFEYGLLKRPACKNNFPATPLLYNHLPTPIHSPLLLSPSLT